VFVAPATLLLRHGNEVPRRCGWRCRSATSRTWRGPRCGASLPGARHVGKFDAW